MIKATIILWFLTLIDYIILKTMVSTADPTELLAMSLGSCPKRMLIVSCILTLLFAAAAIVTVIAVITMPFI